MFSLIAKISLHAPSYTCFIFLTLYRPFSWVKVENDGSKIINETSSITVQIFPFMERPTNACFYLDLVNSDERSRHCYLWGHSEEECRYLFPEARTDCVLWGPEFDEDGEATVTEVYFKPRRFDHLFQGRNRVSNETSTEPMVVTRQRCDLPIVELHSRYKCVPESTCDPNHPTSLKHYKSIPLNIEPKVRTFCLATDIVIFEWKFRYLIDRSQVWQNYSDTLKGKHPDDYEKLFNGRDIFSVTFQTNSLEYGLYEICLNVSMFDVEGMKQIFLSKNTT